MRVACAAHPRARALAHTHACTHRHARAHTDTRTHRSYAYRASDYPRPLFRLSVPLILLIRTAYSDYPYRLFRLPVPLVAIVRTPYYDRSYPALMIIRARNAPGLGPRGSSACPLMQHATGGVQHATSSRHAARSTERARSTAWLCSVGRRMRQKRARSMQSATCTNNVHGSTAWCTLLREPGVRVAEIFLHAIEQREVVRMMLCAGIRGRFCARVRAFALACALLRSRACFCVGTRALLKARGSASLPRARHRHAELRGPCAHAWNRVATRSNSVATHNAQRASYTTQLELARSWCHCIGAGQVVGCETNRS
jgi:hypothetical protein